MSFQRALILAITTIVINSNFVIRLNNVRNGPLCLQLTPQIVLYNKTIRARIMSKKFKLGRPRELKGARLVAVRLPGDMVKALQKGATAQGTSLSALVRQALAEWLQTQQKGRKQ